MEWSVSSATNAYLDTLKLCNDEKRRQNSWKTPELESNEFISALAAGMKAKLIVEVTSGVSPSTIALAAAARQTGGRLVCILPERVLDESTKVIKDSGLRDMVEFKTGDPYELLPRYEKIDFSFVDCKTENYSRLVNVLDVNPRRSVVVANNLVGGKKGLGGHVKGLKDKVEVRSIGKGMEVTMIRRSDDTNQKSDCSGRGGEGRGHSQGERRRAKGKWIVKVDEESGEEHFFRMPRSL
ncbi:hypothetical protein PVL29_020196 [Vitis rotundifolia]|uniref:S-adenosyl-L-methionine-dependent methyltransferase n=1 Tax=Vitis rotundifolia TaxID=103349 RepID=A0AA39DES8_VITRO|nr:hypothetical protein PVL29_020196 [Vitis rotundifolia]